MDELMEQLPGVQICDGKYYWMGKPVVIIFNGKLLFLKAPTVLNSLPSEAIKNVKAYQKSDNDIDPNLQGMMVLDINVKKKWMEEWYGNARIGAGDHSKYVGQIQATSLSEKTPITIKANMNNIGEQNRYYGNWSYVDKLEPSTQQSIEAQMSRNKKIGENGFSSFSTNAHYLDTNKNINRYNNTSESLNDSSNNYSISKSQDFSCNKDAEWDLSGEQLTQKNKFNYSGELNHMENRTTGFSQTAQFDKDPYKLNSSPLENIDSIHQAIVNETVNKSYGANHLTSGHLFGNYIHNFNAKNNLIIKVDVNFNDHRERSFDRSDIRYYRNSEKESELVNHYTLLLNSFFSTDISVKWNVSLVKQFMNMILSYSFKPEYSHAKKDLYRLERLGDIISFGQLPNDSLMSKAYDISNSSHSTMHKLEHEILLEFNVSFKNIVLLPGLFLIPQREHLNFFRGSIDTCLVRHVAPLKPYINTNIKMGHFCNLSTSYQFETIYPELQSLIPYTDDSSPLYIVKTNSNLKPTRRHSIQVNCNANLPEHQQTIMGNINYMHQTNEIGNITHYNEQTGGSISQMENIRGGMNMDQHGSYQRCFGNHLITKIDESMEYSTHYGKISVGTDPTVRENCMRNFNVESNISGSYSFSKLIGTLRGILKYGHVKNQLQPDNNVSYRDYGGCIEGTWRNHWADLTTDFTLLRRRGYADPSINKLKKLWNLSLERKILNNNGTFLLTFSDIFHERTNYNYYAQENIRIESSSDIAINYVLFTFRYNLERKK
jgi:hypothetical protein